MMSNFTDLISNYTDYFGPFQTGLFGTWLIIIIITSIIGNVMVIIVILRDSNMRAAKNGTNLFLFNLAISDMMVGICMAPVSLNTLIYEKWQFPQWFCSMNSFLNSVFLSLSIHTLMYISIHKYFSLKRHSNGDRTFISRKICVLMIVAAWLWGIMLGVAAVSGLSKAVYRQKKLQCGPMYPYVNIPKDSILFFANFTINILLPIVIMGITYRKIFTILHQSAIFRRNSATSTEDIFSDDKRVIITLILVLGVFIVCWLPYVVYIFLALMLEDKNDIPSYINPLAYCSGFTNSICNPVIYAFRFKDFRKGYKQILQRSSCMSTRDLRMIELRESRRPSQNLICVGT
ncbi:neuropeptide CCHamide-1 receptor-like [Mytilus galloprovincialis]|uniref:neuropeptide CCHamide-1 receptor-like n=1 Tax=Mytilus galloprovincialis TaxID=29158 RepID=UPI003F7B6FAB